MCGNLIRFLAEHSSVCIFGASRRDSRELCKAGVNGCEFQLELKDVHGIQ